VYFSIYFLTANKPASRAQIQNIGGVLPKNKTGSKIKNTTVVKNKAHSPVFSKCGSCEQSFPSWLVTAAQSYEGTLEFSFIQCLLSPRESSKMKALKTTALSLSGTGFKISGMGARSLR
jgi:hypothetical protein